MLGPAIVYEENTSTFVNASFDCEALPDGALRLNRVAPPRAGGGARPQSAVGRGALSAVTGLSRFFAAFHCRLNFAARQVMAGGGAPMALEAAAATADAGAPGESGEQLAVIQYQTMWARLQV